MSSMWTDEERKIASRLMESKETMAFLKKLYCPDRSKTRTELEALMTMDALEYGLNMKAMVIAEAHFADRHATIRKIALKEKDADSPLSTIAPR